MPDPPQQVTDNIHRVADGVVNYYIVTDGADGLALVDSGWPRSWPGIVQSLASLGRSPADLDAVILTHGHPDHLGGAEHARRQTSAPVLAPRREVERVRGQAPGSSPWTLVPALTLQLWRPATMAFVGKAAVKGFLQPKWVEEVQPFDIGDKLDWPGTPRVISTPGHTEGHVSLHFEDDGALIAGDALVTRDPVTGATGPRLPHDVLASDPEQARTSLATIADLDAGLVLGGHGEPWSGSAKAAAEQAQARASEA